MDKILIYAMSVNNGGVEEYVMNLSRYNLDKICTYEYIIDGTRTPYEEEMKSLGLKYYFMPPKNDLIGNIKTMDNLLRERRRDCETIYFNTSGIYYPVPYILAEKYKYRIIIHSHLTGASGWRILVHKLNRAWIMPFCDKMLACSTPAAEWMFGKKNLARATIIPNAINIERFRFNPSVREKMRIQLGLEGYFVLGHVGRLTAVKNQSFLIDILAESRKMGLNYKLLLVGDGEDDHLLKEKAKQSNLMNDIIFYGNSSKPEELLSCMDCFVMPSIVEGFPISLVEAQASGLRCIVSDSITTEVNLTGDVSYISIKEPVSKWLKQIRDVESYRNINSPEILYNLGYDLNGLERLVWDNIKSQE